VNKKLTNELFNNRQVFSATNISHWTYSNILHNLPSNKNKSPNQLNFWMSTIRKFTFYHLDNKSYGYDLFNYEYI